MASKGHHDFVPQAPFKPNSKSRNARPRRPNYNYIHRNLLPIDLHPLPVLIPHNPLSLVAIALSYFAQLVYTPAQPIYSCYFSPSTSSIHVTDPMTVRKLWEMGFFGKGSLSRSEPTWSEGQKKKGITAEENTGQRRAERRQQKMERARKEQEHFHERLHSEASGQESVVPLSETSAVGVDGIADHDAYENDLADSRARNETTNATSYAYNDWHQTLGSNGLPTPPRTSASSDASQSSNDPSQGLQRTKTVRFSPTTEAREFDLSSPTTSPIKDPGFCPVDDWQPGESNLEISQEHLQLSLEEAFFLAYGLGVLRVLSDDSDTLLSPRTLLSLFRRHSYSPTRSLTMPVLPDDPFMVSYAVYHHYRSLGWVLRSGVKFSVDYLLYNRGPAFAHAEFAVVIIPSYTHIYWHETEDRRKQAEQKSSKSWWWMHSLNRVQAQVMKNLVLCYVEIPGPLQDQGKIDIDDIGRLLATYKIRDVGIKRWTPNRTRD